MSSHSTGGVILPQSTGANAIGAENANGLQANDGTSFKDYLLNSIEQVNSMQQDADQAVQTLFTGGDANPAEVLTAVQKADIAFRMIMQIRNKLVSAYEEIQDIRI
ncbi:MAG TPA: flagellar hook-basal body complex protein FliE [Pirellulales bacterium]|nr:flagellar hook-basal body complex protein FliE [Pirellulales bacterium]